MHPGDIFVITLWVFYFIVIFWAHARILDSFIKRKDGNP